VFSSSTFQAKHQCSARDLSFPEAWAKIMPICSKVQQLMLDELPLLLLKLLQLSGMELIFGFHRGALEIRL